MSSIAANLQALLEHKAIICPKQAHTREGLIFTFGEALVEAEEAWLVPCSHHVYSPASQEDIVLAERALGFFLPENLGQFLQLTNGAQLYAARLAWKPEWVPGNEHIEYHIFSTAELVTVNQNLLSWFRSMLGDDPDFRDHHALNYIAFCDGHDGNYLAILLEGPEKGKVFFLNHEYLFRPYSELDTDLYFTVAKSFGDWLELLVRTKGRGGFGKQLVPI